VVLIDILALLAAIVLVTRIVQLRLLAALPFARVRAQFVPNMPISALADLHADAARQLAALGFGPARRVHVRSTDSSLQPLREVHVHAQAGAAVWLSPSGPQAPNRLNVFYVTRLGDGRTLITQPYDSYFLLYASANTLAQSVAADSFAEQWASHCAWVATHGEADLTAIEPEQLLGFCVEWMESQRQSLIASGDLVEVDAELARPSLRFAWRALGLLRRNPKPPADTSPVPPARVAMLALQLERIRQRSPSRAVEMTLFAGSLVLFMALGALLWDLMFAWMILVVVIIHELGHFLAMRAFGYRNVHMLALPLVGGVAIGQDVNPSAWRSAWMSLMGPLPGILIGWLILAALVFGWWPSDGGDPWTWALMFLLVNYLNVLPIPPLDGAHVVQAMLPARQAWLEVAFVGVACTLGAWAAWTLDFHLLALIAGLQLLTLGGRWNAQRAQAQVAQDAPAADLARPLRVQRMAQSLERVLGPTPLGKIRAELTLEVLQRLDRKAMRPWQWLVIGLVYLALLAVPVAALVSGMNWRGDMPDEASLQALNAATEQANREFSAAARAQSNAELLADLVADGGASPAPAAGASEAALAQALAREPAQALPQALLDLYRIHDGIAALSIDPIAQLRRAGAELDSVATYLPSNKISVDLLAVDAEEGARIELDLDSLRSWWLIGAFEGDLILVNPDPAATPVQVLELWLESPTGYRSIREWLEQRWISAQQAKRYAEQMRAQELQAYQQLQGADWPRLLQAMQPQQMPFPYSLLSPDTPWPQAASAADIAAIELRLGVSLPADLRALIEVHDGLPPLRLGPSSDWRLVDRDALADYQWYGQYKRYALETISATAGEPIDLQEVGELLGCWQLAAAERPTTSGLLWCPPGHQHAGIVDLTGARKFNNMLDFATVRAAQISARDAG
jgi:Zn-dependent protease